MDIKYNITYHAVQRLQERFSVFCGKIPLLKSWKKEQGINCLKPLFNKMLELSEENKSYQNNSTYMLQLYEKYGYDNEYCFLEFKEENILFLLTKARSSKEYMLVTLMPTEYRPGVKNIKYAGKEDRQLLFNKFLMDWSKPKLAINNQFNINTAKCINLEQKVSLPINVKEIKKNIENTEDNSSKPINKETQLLHELLISSIKNNLALQIERFSNSKAIYSVLLDNKEYEFTYSKSVSGIKKVIIHSTNEVNLNDKLRVLNPDTKLYQAILELIKNNKAILNNEFEADKKIYTVQLYNNVHNISLIENHNDKPSLFMKQNKSLPVSMQIDYEELRNSGENIQESNPLYQILVEAINKEKFKVIEKYSLKSSLRISTINDIDYQYVYIKKDNKEKEIILQSVRKKENQVSFDNFTLLAVKEVGEHENTNKMRI